MQQQLRWPGATTKHIKPPPGYVPTGSFKGISFTIRKLDAPWIVVDEVHSRDGVTLVVLDDRDDPDHRFLASDAWELFPNRRRLAEQYNLPFRRSMRLAHVRMTEFGVAELARLTNWAVAVDALALQDKIRATPGDEVFHVGLMGTRYEWSPSGQVWKGGERWVVITAPAKN